MSGTSDKFEWYLARDGQQHGPLTGTELDKFIELGHLRPTDLLWRAGFDDWRNAAEVFPPRPPEEPATPKPAVFAPTSVTPAAIAPTAGQQSPAANPGAVSSETTQPVDRSFAPSSEHAEPAPNQQTQQATHLEQALAAGTAQPQSPQVITNHDAMHPMAPHTPSVTSPSAVTQRPVQHSQSQFGAPSGAQPSRTGPGPADFGQTPRDAVVPAASTSVVAAGDMDDDAFADDDDGDGRSGWLTVAAALFVFVILGAGGLFAYNNQSEIASFYADLAGKSTQANNNVAVVRAPKQVTREAADATKPSTVTARLNKTDTARASAAKRPLPELPILKSKLWQFAQREFGEWTEKRLAFVRQLSDQDKPKEEANKYIVESFVKFRRDNAAVALLASPEKLAQIANAFVESLQALTAQGPNTCYAFISNGESTPEVAPYYFKPDTGPKLEAQMLAIMQAIVDGRATPKSDRQPPSADDFNKLSAELGKRGWTPDDLKLFSDPNALSKAKPEVVCRLVTEWFATQTKLADQLARDQLIAASLRPVIGG